MPEEKQENKKPPIVKRILKWISLGLLSVLLIAAIIFQAPWKVITLLIIFLLACTALPKPYRKWFWLSVGLVIIALIIWVFLPDDNEGWQPYTFDEERAALETRHAIPDSENAAIIYNQLLESYADEDFNMPEDFPIREPWRGKDNPEAAKWLEQHQMAIQTLMEAAKLEKCRFPVNSDIMSLGQGMSRVSKMTKWTYLLISAGNNDLGEGKVGEALEKYMAVLQMAKHQFQQPRIIDFLVGIALEASAIRQFNNFIVTGNATEEHLRIIEEALAEIKHDWSSDLSRISEYEKFPANILSNFYEENPEGKTRLNRNLLKSMNIDWEEMGIKESELYWRRKTVKASTILQWFYMPSTPQKAGEIIDASFERYYLMAKPDFDWQKGPRKFSPKFRLNFRYILEVTANMLEAPYYRIHDIYLQLLTDKRGSEILIALRHYKNKTGHWPESLDEIKTFVSAETFTDPTNGGEYVYKLTDESFILYSKGKNNIDEGGKYKRGPDDWPIWPPKSRKTKEEKSDAE